MINIKIKEEMKIGKAKSNAHKYSFFAVITIVLLASCDNNRIYETNKDFANHRWYEDSVCSFTFDIQDSEQAYNILYNVRNTLNYPYYNLYVKYSLKAPNGKEIAADLQEMQLMDAKTGKPFGSGMGDIFDNQIIALKNFKFTQAGKYTFSATQYMRKNPIEQIMSFGIRVEKAKK